MIEGGAVASSVGVVVGLGLDARISLGRGSDMLYLNVGELGGLESGRMGPLLLPFASTSSCFSSSLEVREK